MTDPSIYRRFGAACSGTRPTLNLGDPGIDKPWMRRRTWGVIAATGWVVLLPIVLGIGFFSRWGVFGKIDTWQLETFGSGNVILLVILFMPLMFLPNAVARLASIGETTPFLLGMRQALDGSWGPRVVGDRDQAVAGFRLAMRVSVAVAAIGAVVAVAGIWKWNDDANAPHASLPRVSFAALTDPSAPLPKAVRVIGVVADKSTSWSYDYSVRQDSHDDVYYPLRLPAEPSNDPVALVELDQVSPQYAHALWNMVDAPGPREGLLSVLGAWEADQLRRAGFKLAPRVLVLKRRQLHGRSPYPDPFDNMLYIMLGSVTLFVSGLLSVTFFRLGRFRAAAG